MIYDVADDEINKLINKGNKRFTDTINDLDFDELQKEAKE